MSTRDLVPAKVIHMRVSFAGNAGAMDIVKSNMGKVCHAFDYRRLGKYVVLMHERGEYCSWCDRVEDYTSYL